MPRPALPLVLAAALAACLAAPTLAQEAEATDEAKPVIILPAPAEADANLQTTPETVKPVGGSGCAHDRAVTS